MTLTDCGPCASRTKLRGGQSWGNRQTGCWVLTASFRKPLSGLQSSRVRPRPSALRHPRSRKRAGTHAGTVRAALRLRNCTRQTEIVCGCQLRSKHESLCPVGTTMMAVSEMTRLRPAGWPADEKTTTAPIDDRGRRRFKHSGETKGFGGGSDRPQRPERLDQKA